MALLSPCLFCIWSHISKPSEPYPGIRSYPEWFQTGCLFQVRKPWTLSCPGGDRLPGLLSPTAPYETWAFPLSERELPLFLPLFPLENTDLPFPAALPFFLCLLYHNGNKKTIDFPRFLQVFSSFLAKNQKHTLLAANTVKQNVFLFLSAESSLQQADAQGRKIMEYGVISAISREIAPPSRIVILALAATMEGAVIDGAAYSAVSLDVC